MILTLSTELEVTYQSGSTKIWIPDVVAQTRVLGKAEAQASRKVSVVFLCSAFWAEPEMTCLSGKETTKRTP